jgi:hypothetical protein
MSPWLCWPVSRFGLAGAPGRAVSKTKESHTKVTKGTEAKSKRGDRGLRGDRGWEGQKQNPSFFHPSHPRNPRLDFLVCCPACETEFRRQVRAQTEFGNEGPDPVAAAVSAANIGSAGGTPATTGAP